MHIFVPTKNIERRTLFWCQVYRHMVSLWQPPLLPFIVIVSPEGTICDTVQVPSGDGDIQLI